MNGDIEDWLNQLGLGQYLKQFSENEITVELLADLDHDILMSMGVSVAGHRIRLLKAIKNTPTETTPSSASNPDSNPTANLSNAPENDDNVSAERRQLTVMFCDLVGSTALSETLDPEVYRELLTLYRTSVYKKIKRYDGFIGKHMGDGLLIYFGYPQAHEDDAERAVRAALAIVHSLSDPPDSFDISLKVRIGIATGLVVAGDIVGEGAAESRAVLGDTPNLASRLQGLAQPNGIIVSDSTRRLLGSLFDIESLGKVSLKGISNQVNAYTVVNANVFESRFHAARGTKNIELVGRHQELGLLKDKWNHVKNIEGQIVIMRGEAGIGKSCITGALIDCIRPEVHNKIVYQCSPYHTDSAFYPTVQQLTFAAGFNYEDSAEQKLEKLEHLLRQGQEDITEAVPLLGALLGIGEIAERKYGVLAYSAQERRDKTLNVLVELLAGLTRYKPLLFIIEDAHWIDPTTLELLDRALDQLGQLKILLLITARPTFQYDFNAHPIVTTLALNKLANDSVTALINQTVNGKKLPDSLINRIVVKTDGVPLFVEELTKTLIESDQLVETNDEFYFSGELDQLSIPNSLHDSLMSRLDRMKSVKEVAQIASCIGREFHYELLDQITTFSSTELSTALEKLVEAEIVFQRGSGSAAKYLFKHALVRDAAYESLLKSDRCHIHKKVLTQMELNSSISPEVLAHHALHANLLAKALTYFEVAGDESFSRSAFNESISHFEQCLQCLNTLDNVSFGKHLDIMVKLSNALTSRFGYSHEKTVAAKAQARQLLDLVENTPHHVPLLYGSWVTHHVAGNHRQAYQDAQRLCEQAHKTKDRIHGLIGYRLKASSLTMQGRVEEADENFKLAFTHSKPEEDARLASQFGSDPSVSIKVCWAIELLTRGLGDKAYKLIDGLEENSRKQGHVNAYAYTLYHLAWFFEYAKHPNRNTQIQLIRELSERYDLKMWFAYSYIQEGAYLFELGQFDEADRHFSQGFELTDQVQVRLNVSYFMALYAQTLAVLGKKRESECLVEELLAKVDSESEQLASAEIFRRIGEICYWHRNDPTKANKYLNRALHIAKQQRTTLWELRTHLTLAQITATRSNTHKNVSRLQLALNDFPANGHQLIDYKDACHFLGKLSEHHSTDNTQLSINRNKPINIDKTTV